MFCHLHVHSRFSPMRGTASIEDLLARTKELGQPGLALTDTNGLWGFVHFTRLAKAAGLQAICGSQILTGKAGQAPAQDLLLLVENQAGYANLSRLISAVHDDPAADVAALLERFGQGLFVLCPDETLLERLAALLPEDQLYAELRPGHDTAPLLRACRRLGLQPVATGAVHFLAPADAPLATLLRAIDRNQRLSELPPWERFGPQQHFADEATLRRRLPHCPQALDNAAALARRCHTEWDFSATIFPGGRNGHDARLRELVAAGAVKRYAEPLPEAVRARIDMELALIGAKGFASYFLVVADIVHKSPLPGADGTRLTIGRGSAAASIVSYCLFITQVDPIAHNLYFERFLHADRTDLPDIDVDFAWDERDAVLAYVFRKYGAGRAAMVSNQVTLQPRSAVREVAKVYGLSNEEILAVTRRIHLVFGQAGFPNRVVSAGPLTVPEEANLSAAAPRLHIDGTLEEILRLAMRLVGVFHYPSVHAGGVVVVPDEIRRYVPVLTAPKGVPIVQWEKDQVEDAGLVKIDLLGNRSLAVVRDALRDINLYGAGGPPLRYHDIDPLDDPATRRLMESGRTMGIFYIESPATRQLLAKAGKVDFEHVVIYSSIIRPAANRFINQLIERIHGRPWKLLHPDLDFLSESYGLMVYEEQVSIAARVLAGFNYADADTLRKIGTKRSLRPMIPALKKQFISGALANGYPEDAVRQVWDMIDSFKGYSFCKPHSASYAMLSFTCAWLKAHHPAEFLAAVISNRGGFYSPYAYMSEARRCGVQILPPHINRSWREWRGKRGRIRMGLMELRHLQGASLEQLLEERKQGDYASLADFLERTDIPFADVRVLIRAGGFDELEPGRSQPDLLLQLMQQRHAHVYAGSGSLLQPQLSAPAAVQLQGLTPAQRYRTEVASFGYPLTWHPLEPYRSIIAGRTILARDLPRHVGRSVTLAGICLTTKTVQTRKGEPMEFLTFEDRSDVFECVLFPAQYRLFNDLVRWEKMMLVTGRVEEAWGTHSVTIKTLASLSRMAREGLKQ